VCEWIYRVAERLFYWQWKCIGSDEWLVCIEEWGFSAPRSKSLCVFG
jgi:hypothetical protein